MKQMTLHSVIVLIVLAVAGSPVQAGDCEKCLYKFSQFWCSDVCENHGGNDDCDVGWSNGWQYCTEEGWSCSGTAKCPNGNCKVVEGCTPENQGAFLIVPNGEAMSHDWSAAEAATSSDESASDESAVAPAEIECRA